MSTVDRVDNPGHVDPALERHYQIWDAVDAVLGGTPEMRRRAEQFMPKRRLETLEDYNKRIAHATFYPAYVETVNIMTGRVFFKPITPNDDVPVWIKKEVLDDADFEGRNLHSYAKNWFEMAMQYGLAYSIIDSPPGSPSSEAERIQAGIRPYCTLVKPNQILGWRRSGQRLTQLRVLFKAEEAAGRFGVKVVDEVRVYEAAGEAVTVEIFRKDDRGEWISGGVNTLPIREIPIVPLYTNRTGFMTAEPPMRELLYLNLKHWRMQSSLDVLVDVACVPILTAIGVDSEDGIVIGAKHAIAIGNKDGRLEYVEITGNSISAGQTHLDKLKDDMRSAGAKLLLISGVSKTALQANEEASRENSPLGTIVSGFRDALTLLMYHIAVWRREATGGTISVTPNLDPDFTPAETMKILNDMADRGRLSDESVFDEAKRRGILGESLEWETELERMKSRPVPPPAPGETLPPAPGNEDEEGEGSDDNSEMNGQ